MAAPERPRLGLRGGLGLAARVVRESVAEWIDDDAARHGAALAYYTVFSVVAVSLKNISIAGLLYGEATARAEVATRLHELLGPEGASAVEGLLNRALPTGSGVLSTVLGVATLLIGASTVFVQLRASLNYMWDVPVRPVSAGKGLLTLLWRQGIGGLMVLAMGAVLLASLTLGTAVSVAAEAVGAWVALSPEDVTYAYQALSFGLVTLVFAGMFKLLPGVPVAWGDVWVGALVTALLFTLGRSAIAMYLAYAGVATAYGAAGSLVAFLVWVYWSAQILLFGAEFTQVYGRRVGSRRREGGLLDKGKKHRLSEWTVPPQ